MCNNLMLSMHILGKELYEHYKTPRPCDQMGLGSCDGAGLGGWTVGMDSYCLPEDFGTLIPDKHADTIAILEVNKKSSYLLLP